MGSGVWGIGELIALQIDGLVTGIVQLNPIRGLVLPGPKETVILGHEFRDRDIGCQELAGL